MISLESALKTLDATEIKAQLTDVKNRCPDAPSVSWALQSTSQAQCWVRRFISSYAVLEGSGYSTQF